MAKVDGPAMSIRASGNVGPLCYATWRGMQIARGRWDGVQVSSPSQEVIRGYYRTMIRAWGNVLNEDQRERWREFARGCRWVNTLGLEWNPDGYRVFVKMGLQAMTLGASYNLDPPAEAVSAHPGIVLIHQPSWPAMVEVSMGDWADGIEPDVIQIWRAGPYKSGGYHARGSDYRVVQVVGSPFSWEDWGVVDVRYYWYRVRWGFNIGVVGNFWEDRVYVMEYPPP